MSATTILLRCVVETGDYSTKESAIVKLESFKSRLETYRDVHGWDLANFCLERCSDAISSLGRILRPVSENPIQSEATPPILDNSVITTAQTYSDGDQTIPASHGDLLLPVDSIDYPWETLWGSFEGPWQITM